MHYFIKKIIKILPSFEGVFPGPEVQIHLLPTLGGNVLRIPLASDGKFLPLHLVKYFGAFILKTPKVLICPALLTPTAGWPQVHCIYICNN